MPGEAMVFCAYEAAMFPASEFVVHVTRGRIHKCGDRWHTITGYPIPEAEFPDDDDPFGKAGERPRDASVTIQGLRPDELSNA